ncbi:MAG TPA: vWA domain-containing protein [Polyangiales bacterium]|nr:vWA domain-containing protein [Polyangiales bacterium]
MCKRSVLVSRFFVILLAACGAEQPNGPANRAGSGPRKTADTDMSAMTASTAPGSVASTPTGNQGPTTTLIVPSSSSVSSAAGSGAAKLPEGTCAKGMAGTTPVRPTIWLVVDGSSSMTMPFGASDRWKTLRSTLMDPGGVVDSLQSVAQFGLVIYSGNRGGGGDTSGAMGDQCVKLVTVQPALNNLAMLLAQYPEEPLGSGTPTDKALDHVVTNLPVNNGMVGPDEMASPIYVVLATDGSPNDSCGGGGFFGGGPGEVEQRVVDVTTKGTENGMLMYVISLAGDDAPLQAHLEQVAAATASKTPPFVPATQQELVQTFLNIVGSASCQIDLNGKVEAGKECMGNVMLNGTTLDCGSDNGWRLVDPDTFTLTGSACESFTNQASTVFADFPCEIFVLN